MCFIFNVHTFNNNDEYILSCHGFDAFTLRKGSAFNSANCILTFINEKSELVNIIKCIVMNNITVVICWYYIDTIGTILITIDEV